MTPSYPASDGLITLPRQNHLPGSQQTHERSAESFFMIFGGRIGVAGWIAGVKFGIFTRSNSHVCNSGRSFRVSGGMEAVKDYGSHVGSVRGCCDLEGKGSMQRVKVVMTSSNHSVEGGEFRRRLGSEDCASGCESPMNRTGQPRPWLIAWLDKLRMFLRLLY